MSSSICQHFTQNAWKKDLCSNCFKSKDEHRQAAAAAAAAAATSSSSSNTASSMASAMSARLSTALSAAHAKFNSSSSAAKAAAAAATDTTTGSKKTDYPNRHKQPAKSSLKKLTTTATTTATSLKSTSTSSASLASASNRSRRVAFSKSLFEVIGYGGEWSDNDSAADDDDDDDFGDDDDDFMNLANDRDDLTAHVDDDEETLELKRITRANTDFNMNNGNLLGDPQDNIKRSFAALKLGAPQVDKEGRKQTLKINVVPFGGAPGAEEPKKKLLTSNTMTAVTTARTNTTSSTTPNSTTTITTAVKAKFETIEAKATTSAINKKIMSTTSTTKPLIPAAATPAKRSTAIRDVLASCSDSDGTNSPPIERAMEKSLLDEISETLEAKQKVDAKKLTTTTSNSTSTTTTTTATPSVGGKIKFEIGSLSETIEDKSTFLAADLKKSAIARNTPITKDTAKPRVNVSHKFSDTESSDGDNNSISAYYDVVETTQVSYENLPDGKCHPKTVSGVKKPNATITTSKTSNATTNTSNSTTTTNNSTATTKTTKEQKTTRMDHTNKSIFSSSQYITDMLLSSKTRAASYSLHGGNFLTATSGQITADGLIVSKCSGADEALDSTGSSFDGSSEDDDDEGEWKEDEGEESSSYNMTRSESDSGIGISIGGGSSAGGGSGASSGDYKNIPSSNGGGVGTANNRSTVEKKLSNMSTNNSDYEDIQVAQDQRHQVAGKQASPPSIPSSVASVAAKLKIPARKNANTFNPDKSRELHGEPDGSADPDGSLEGTGKESTGVTTPTSMQLPALPKSPPPAKIIDARPSFLHGLAPKPHQPPMVLKKPDLPVKPTTTTSTVPNVIGNSGTANAALLKASPFGGVRRIGATGGDQQQQAAMIQQLQMLQMRSAKSNESISALDDAAAKEDEALKLRKGRAPNPPPELKDVGVERTGGSAPPTPERDYSLIIEDFERATEKQEADRKIGHEESIASLSKESPSSTDNLYSRQTAIAATTPSHKAQGPSPVVYASPVTPEKKKRERAVINPKFRSLNTFVMQRNNNAKNLQLQNATSALNLKQPMTPEPTPRHHPKALSMSEECLTAAAAKSALSSTVNPNMGASVDKPLYGNNMIGAASSASPPKTKNKFSIKKFLRMGNSSSSSSSSSSAGKILGHSSHGNAGMESLLGRSQRGDGIYSEICTGDEGVGVSGKPRLVIIHPIDINPTAVEVVRSSTSNSSTKNGMNNMGITTTDGGIRTETAKPPAPPQRASVELNKPARPPPPKSAELRRKQKTPAATINGNSSVAALHAAGDVASNGGIGSGGSIKCKADNVYANLGEIRSSIAPRKPERTASMREREAQLELVRKRHIGGTQADTVSICSSNGEFVSAADQQKQKSIAPGALCKAKASTTIATASPQLSMNGRCNTPLLDAKPPSGSRTSTFERQKKAGPDGKSMTAGGISSKLEIFEQRSNGSSVASDSGASSRNGTLKDTVRKVNSTIDSYLKDKRDYENMYEFVKIGAAANNHAQPTGNNNTATSPVVATPTLTISPVAATPPPPPARSLTAALLLPAARTNRSNQNQLYADTVSIASYTRSEYGPVRNYGHFNGSLANIPRVISASYCGSEAGDIDIYSPYSYYGSEAGGDVAGDINDSVWGMPSAAKNRSKATNRLRLRKGRSVVHKNIEDNYTAVVVANHEALAQVLEQLQLQPIIPPALRPLANAINLRFEDFTILEGAQAFVVGKKAFHAAVWTTAPVTLALSADCNQLAGVGGELHQLSGGVSGVLNPITEFCDLVPSYHLPLMPSTEVSLLQATISVLPRLQLDTLQSIGAILKSKSQVLDKSNFNFRGSIPNLTGLKEAAAGGGMALARHVVSVQNLSTLNEENSLMLEQMAAVGSEENGTANGMNAGILANGINAGMPAFDDVMSREVAFIMLQLVNGMKNLQVKAVEEMPLSLSNVVLSKDVENKDAQARLCVLQCNNSDEDESLGTLCKCAHIALTEMLPPTKITPILADILAQERAESLSKAKSVLEFILWGPSDVVLSGSIKERELALQRWLDLERATVLHGLVRTRVELTVYDECHLMFLVRSTAKMMNDAAKIVCNYQMAGIRGGSQTASTAGIAN